MIDPNAVPSVDSDELLARYVLQRSYVRSDNTVRQNAFIPYPHPDLSVTRHRSATDAEIWLIGTDIATNQQKTLYGRADVAAHVCLQQELRVVPDPVASNPNHATITNWPAEKPAQKMIALELAARSQFVSAPVDGEPFEE